jgi:hypothetical protein
MRPALLAEDGDGIGRDCSMPLALVGESAQECLHLGQRAQREVRSLDQFQPGAALALGHPFRDDEQASTGMQATERAFTRRGDIHPRRREHLAAELVPRVMDGDRS